MQQAGRAVDDASWSWEGLTFEVVKTQRYSVLSAQPPSAPLFSFLSSTAPWAADNVFSFCSQKDLRNVGVTSRKLLQLSPFRTPHLIELFGWPSSLDPGALRHLELHNHWIDDCVRHAPNDNSALPHLQRRLHFKARDFGVWDERRDDVLINHLAAFSGSIQLLELHMLYSRPEEVFYARVGEKLTFPSLQHLALRDRQFTEVSFLR